MVQRLEAALLPGAEVSDRLVLTGWRGGVAGVGGWGYLKLRLSVVAGTLLSGGFSLALAFLRHKYATWVFFSVS